MNLNDTRQHAEQPDNPENQEQVLLLRCQRGDKIAFNQFILRYQDKIYTYVSQFIDDTTQARELTRDIFVAAYKALPRIQTSESVKFWLMTLTEERVRRAVRRQQSWYRRYLPFRHQDVFQEDAEEHQEHVQTDCGTIRDLLSAYLDGETSEIEAKRVEKHLERCAACRREFEELQDTLALVQTFGPQHAPPDLRPAIQTALERLPVWKEKMRLFFATPGIPASALAVTCVLIFLVGGIILQEQRYALLKQDYEQQSIVRGVETLQTPSDETTRPFVLVTGKLVSEEFLLDLEDRLQMLFPRLEKFTTRFLSGDMDEIVQEIKQQISVMRGEIVEDHLLRKDDLMVRKILVDVPATPGALFTLFLQQLSPEDATPELSITRLEIYLLDRP